jgi:hypothetical protein
MPNKAKMWQSKTQVWPEDAQARPYNPAFPGLADSDSPEKDRENFLQLICPRRNSFFFEELATA